MSIFGTASDWNAGTHSSSHDAISIRPITLIAAGCREVASHHWYPGSSIATAPGTTIYISSSTKLRQQMVGLMSTSIHRVLIFTWVLLLIAKDMICRVHVIDMYLYSWVTEARKISSHVMMSGRWKIDTQESVPDCYNSQTLYWSLLSVPNNKLYWHSLMSIQASSLWIAIWQGRASSSGTIPLCLPNTTAHDKISKVLLHTVSKQILEVVKDWEQGCYVYFSSCLFCEGWQLSKHPILTFFLALNNIAIPRSRST